MAGLSEALHDFFEARIKGVHTMLPGVVRLFDPSTQRATVAIGHGLMLRDADGGLPHTVPYPQLLKVPVQMPRWGAFQILMPVRPGDECAVFFSERSMERFLTSGASELGPTTPRLFDLADGFAVMGLASEGQAVTSYPVDAMEIRTSDGPAGLTARFGEDGTLEVTNATESLIPLLAEILLALSTENVVVGSGSSAGTYTLTGAVQYGLLKTRLETFT